MVQERLNIVFSQARGFFEHFTKVHMLKYQFCKLFDIYKANGKIHLNGEK